MLDIECFTYLNRALESSISPIVILASNRGTTIIKGTEDLSSAHGIPPDLLPRLLIVPTHPYNGPEIKKILSTRATLEYSSQATTSLAQPTNNSGPAPTSAASLTDEALEELTKQGESVSLRYALQLLAPARILARIRASPDGAVGAEDIREACGLFLDAKRSAGTIRESANGFIY